MARPAGCGVRIRVGTDLASLADDLAERLARPALGVLEPEVVVVPTPGIRQWLEQRLSHSLGAIDGDGISSNLDVLFFDGLLRRVTGRGRARDDSWATDRMALCAVELLADAPVDSPLARLRPSDGVTGLFERARGAADVFDQLFRWRPDVVEHWLADPTADPRAPLLAAIAERTSATVPSRELAETLERLEAGDDRGLDLPARLHLFGGDSLPGGPSLVSLLDALGCVRDVSMHVVVASSPRFDATRRGSGRFGPLAPERSGGDDAGWHPLLRTWGAPGRETAMLLAQLPERATTSFATVPPSAAPALTLLGALQASVRGPATEPVDAVGGDRSVELHGCVGDLRQVEAARDAILHALEDDPSLAPGDVLVLCADLPRFAPLLDAVLAQPHGAPWLAYRMADRSLSRAIPLVASTSRALGLLGGRFTRSSVLDLLRDHFVQARFDLAEEDADRFVEWTDAAEVRWGLDGAHRSSAGLPETFEAGTWRRALDRLLLGAALPAGGVAPSLGLRALDPGYEVERLGTLCSVLAALSAFNDECATCRTIPAWCDLVRELTSQLFDVGYEEAWQLEHLHRLLASIADDAAELEVAVAFAVFRAAFDERAARARTLTANGPGGVTVTSFAPLRNVPFEVVCVLGLDEGVLQQATSQDVAFGAPRIGDRDARGEVQAALLGAVLAARSRLLVTYEAADVVTNQDVPTSTALAELIEAIDRVCVDGAAAVSYRHPRHAHGDADLTAMHRLGGVPFGFDRAALERAVSLRAHRGRPSDAARTFSVPAPPRAGGANATASDVDARALVGFLGAPQRTFLREVLGAWVPQTAEPPHDDLPTSLGNLEAWKVSTELVHDGDATLAPGSIETGEWDGFVDAWASTPDSAVGGLAGRLASDALRGRGGAAARSRELLRHLRGRTAGLEATPVECRVELADGTCLVGVPFVYGDRTTVRWSASGGESRVRLASTVDLLLLTAQHPEIPWRATRIWRSKDSASSKVATVAGDGPDERREQALRALERLQGLRRIGLQAPVPLFFRVTMHLLSAIENRPGLTAEQLIVDGLGGWEVYEGFGDRDDAAVRFCFDTSYEAVCALRCEPGDPVPSRPTGDSRMLAFSLALCEALLDLSPLVGDQ